MATHIGPTENVQISAKSDSLMTECLFCDSLNIEFCFRGSDRQFEIEGVYEIYKCKDCGLLFLNPPPSASTIGAHYPRNYYSLEGERPDEARTEKIYEALVGPQTSLIKKLAFLPYRPLFRTLCGRAGQRVLDVGCGSGHFLAIARKTLNVEAYGIEPYAYNESFATTNNLNIYNGKLEDANFQDGFFDVITLNHVLEHVENPRQTLRELRRILKPGGTLILGVPQSRNVLYWLFGTHWLQLDVPRHLFIPSTANLAALARREGFTVKRVRYNSIPDGIRGTLHYWRTRKSKVYLSQVAKDNPVSARLTFWALLPISYLFNLFRVSDQIEMFLTTE